MIPGGVAVATPGSNHGRWVVASEASDFLGATGLLCLFCEANGLPAGQSLKSIVL